MTANAASLPFKEAIDYFRQKVDLPTQRWADMLEGQHTRAFTVAGAVKDDLLTGFREAIDKAISQGTSLEEFRKDFDDLVAKHGWSYKGSRGWRTRTIYQTNLSTAYAAGRWKQMTDPDVLRYQPYWRYRHNDNVLHPRPEHVAWDGLVLMASDPWIRTHACPNGWGCECTWETLSRREMKAMGKASPDQAPAEEMRPATLATSWGPQTIMVPKGVDPGWGYSVGETAFGRELPQAEMDAWRSVKAEAWETLTPGDWRSAGRPERMPVDAPKAKLGPKARNIDELARMVATAIGGDQVAIEAADGSTILVDAAALASHIELGRAPFVPLLPELLSDPFEIWLRFDRHKGTGKVILRKRFVKVVALDKDRGLLMVADASRGMFGGWTFHPLRNIRDLQDERAGRLLWGRKL